MTRFHRKKSKRWRPHGKFPGANFSRARPRSRGRASSRSLYEIKTDCLRKKENRNRTRPSASPSSLPIERSPPPKPNPLLRSGHIHAPLRRISVIWLLSSESPSSTLLLSGESASGPRPPFAAVIYKMPSKAGIDGGGSHLQSQRFVAIDGENGSTGPAQERVNLGGTKRAKWSHQTRVALIELLKDHDVPGFRNQNSWSKEAWNNIVCRLNAKFGTDFTLAQAKQKEQDLKKDYRVVKDLLDQSGFGWNNERMMVEAPESVWASFASRKNSEAALSWKDKSFPYFNDLFKLYDGRYAEGRTRQGMDHYVRKSKKNISGQAEPVAETYQTPSPTLNGLDESGLQFHFDEEMEEANLDRSQCLSAQVPPSSTPLPSEVPEGRRGKKQKSKSASPDDGFHERYLKLKKEEIERFAAIEEKKLEDPYSINKCINVLEELDGLPIGDLLMASDIFMSKDNREVFLSFKSDALQLAWVNREINRRKAELPN